MRANLARTGGRVLAVACFGALFIAAAEACRSHASPRAPGSASARQCTPWRVAASDENIHVELLGGHWQFDGGATLVGCKEILSGLTPQENHAAVRGVTKFVEKEGLRAVLLTRDPAVRQSAVSAVNDAVGRTVVTDVEAHFSFSEDL